VIAISCTSSEYWISARPAAESRAFLLVEVTALLRVLQQFSCKLEQKVVEAIAIVQNAYNSEIEQLTKYAIVMVIVTEWSTCFHEIFKFDWCCQLPGNGSKQVISRPAKGLGTRLRYCMLELCSRLPLLEFQGSGSM